MADSLGGLDDLIEQLETVLDHVDEYEFDVVTGGPPKRAFFKVVAAAFDHIIDRKAHAAEVHRVSAGQVLMRSRDDVGAGSDIEINILVSKDGHGETLHLAKGRVKKIRRISGAYEIQAEVTDMQRMVIPAYRRFYEFVGDGDSAGWNHWCADLSDGPVLQKLNLKRAQVTNFDLCCADLTGSDFREANLSGCNLSGAVFDDCLLDGTIVTGADLFRARLPRRYMGLIAASGMIEVESVILVD